MRQQVKLAFPRPTRLVWTLIGIQLATFVLTALFYRAFAAGEAFFALIPMSPANVLEGQLWRVVTYAIFPDISGPGDVLGNCVLLYFFASDLERRWGQRRFILFLLLTALGGAASIMVAALLGFASPGLGAGAITWGMVVAWSLTFPDRPVLFGLRGIHLLYFSCVLTALSAVSVSAPTAIPIGGMLVAAALVLGLWRKNRMKLWWDKLLVALRIRKPPKLYVVPKPRGDGEKWVH